MLAKSQNVGKTHWKLSAFTLMFSGGKCSCRYWLVRAQSIGMQVLMAAADPSSLCSGDVNIEIVISLVGCVTLIVGMFS